MFTGIVQGIATVQSLVEKSGLHSVTLRFPPGFTTGLFVGASVSVDGVCLTVTDMNAADTANFDVMLQSLSVTTLPSLREGGSVNVERAARDGAEIGGHPLSGHVDCRATINDIRRPENNQVLRIGVPAPWMRYIFAKGYIAVNGCSLTAATAHREHDGSGWFEVWLIPETLRMTTFANKTVGDAVNIEIERQTQVVVDTIRDAIEERLGALQPVLEALLRERGVSLDDLAQPLVLSKPG